MTVQTFVDASPYLGKLYDQHGDSQADYFATFAEVCQALERYRIDDINQAEAFLLDCKSRFALAWSLAELCSYGERSERGRWQTTFAETTIDFALRIAWLSIAAKHKAIAKIVRDAEGRLPGQFIFGMGKLGGYDLNFSSDVDLVAYFDPAELPVPEILGKSYICHQVLQKLTQCLGQGGDANFVWRVDWRLRPNASANTLAMSVEAARQYYFYQASPWHRLALMKARVVAGDYQSGNQFLDGLLPFIWRQNLDYRAFDELAEIKQRINLEHPALRTQRQWREPIVDDIAGFNVKLGSGGIREIEFIANALQLVWGGREHGLRTSNTVEALHQLAAHKHLPLATAQSLVDCYETLRRVENAIQIYANQQTHLVPHSQTAQQHLLTLLNLNVWGDLVVLLNQTRRLVNVKFEELFAEQAASKGEPPVWPENMSAQTIEIVDGWEDGYQVYGVSPSVRHRLLPLTRAIANYLGETGDQDSNDTIVRLHDFFRSLPKGEQYFRLLAESPKLLRSVVPPLLYSPAMTVLLKQSPHIVDCYVRGGWQYPQAFDSDSVTKVDDYGERLERLRRFVNEHLYQLYLGFLQGEFTVSVFQQALTELAEHTLELALAIVAENMQLDTVPIAVVGMGKVALRKMSPLSDLDLIFIYSKESTSLQTASRFVSRLQTAISTPMQEGIVYELDTRLRPSGRSGAPTVSTESFANHHRQRAHTWEHIALMSSRLVAGNKQLRSNIDGIKRAVLTSPRDSEQFFRDAQKMWNRIATHRVSQKPIDVMSSKLRIGGLMQAEYLAACIVLQAGKQYRSQDIEFDALLSSSVNGTRYQDLPEIIQFWRVQQLWERLLGNTDKPLSDIHGAYLDLLLAHSGVDSMSQLNDKKANYIEWVTRAMKDFFSAVVMDYKQIDDWHERSVDWLNE